MIGKTISHYKIIEKLGEGGMGVVCKAEDTKLQRTVALKFLPRETKGTKEEEKLVSEARAAAALDHPNICTIYEIGQAEGRTFIAMAYVEGEDLRDTIASGPMKLTDALDISIQIANGLRAAHRKGVVHRDIKPANIMITGDMQVKIMDFGLARSGKQETPEGESTAGTAAYMSPEQISREATDHRTDIWSLGVALYEMLAGQRPFKGGYEQAVFYSILNEEPERVSKLRKGIPPGLDSILGKALAKSPGSRYQDVSEFLSELQNLHQQLVIESTGTRPAAYRAFERRSRAYLIPVFLIVLAMVLVPLYVFFGRRDMPAEKKQALSEQPRWENSIAVLPFRDFSPGKDQEYFSQGMTDAIISKLSSLEGLKVISMSSVLKYRDTQEDVRKIGRELDVETILEGSIQKEEDRIRLPAQLVNTGDGAHLWTETYDRELESVFAIQDEISQAIVDAMKLRLLGDEEVSLVKRHTENIDAYNAYVQGRFMWNKRTEEHLNRAIDYFREAIEHDPEYALAYAGLADAYAVMPTNIGAAPEDVYPQAKEAAERALELDDELAEAHASLGLVLAGEGDFEGAEKEYLRAIELNPGYAYAHYWYSITLDAMGRGDEAIEQVEMAFELNPLSVVILVNMASRRANDGELDEADRLYRRAIEVEPARAASYIQYALTLRNTGRVQEGIEMYLDVLEIDPLCEDAYNGLAYAYLQLEDIDTALEYANKFVEIAPDNANAYDTRGEVYALVGMPDRAISDLRHAMELNPELEASWRNLGGIMLIQGKYAAVDSMMQLIMAVTPEEARADARTGISLIPMSQGKFAEALKQLNEGIKDDMSGGFEERAASKHVLKAMVFNEIGQSDSAITEADKTYEIVLRLYPATDVCDRLEYARILAEAGEYQRAEHQAEIMRDCWERQDPSRSGEYWRAMGHIEFARGNYDRAAELLARALEMNLEAGAQIGFFHLRYYLGRAYLEAGMAEQAIEQLEKSARTYAFDRATFIVFSVKTDYYLGIAYEEAGLNEDAIARYEAFLESWKDADPGLAEVEDARDRLGKLRSHG
jgi:serine/threonine protein kinase/tetratricopeptide (TPR) repeat protein